jgi:signal transduction histidine kinase
MAQSNGSDFISIASHQLRTPLTAIKWYADILLSGKSGDLTAQQREFVLEMYHANERMVRLVDNLLIVEQAEKGNLPVVIRSTALAEIATNVMREYEALAKAKRIALIKHCEGRDIPLVKIDPIYMRVAIKNIMDNALRYTLNGGSVTTNCEYKDSKMTLTISDTGIGIPTEDQGRVFTKFFRSGNSRELQADGSGLGLYIAKVIIEHNGGKIWFESTATGSAFYVQFPVGGETPGIS